MTKINTPGVYDIPMVVYHSDCCAGPSVSASSLWGLLECPAKYWDASYLNPARVPDETTPALDVGRAAHCLVLGEPEFNASFVVCPHDNLAKNPGKQWNDEWKARVADGSETRTLIRDFDTIRQIAAAQLRAPQVARAFRNGMPERSLIWRDEETGVWLKSRPDWLPDDPAQGFLIDYKTARSIRPKKLGYDAFGYGYHVQAAMQFDAVWHVLGIKPLGIAHVVQEKESPYLAELRMFDARQLDHGRRAYRRALRLFKQCWQASQAGKPVRSAWPGYTDEPSYFLTPYETEKQMQEEEEHGNAE